MDTKMQKFEQYLTEQSDEVRAAFEHIGALVIEVEPEAEKSFAYAMPMYTYMGKNLLGFLSWKKHLSIYPCSGRTIDSMREKLHGFDLTSGSIHFTLEKPLPEEVLREIIRTRLKEMDSAKMSSK